MLPEAEPSYGKLAGLIMLVFLGGKERTQSKWSPSLQGGFELGGITLTSLSEPPSPESPLPPP